MVEFTGEVIWLLFVGKYLTAFSILVVMIGLLMISVSSWFSFGRLCFSKNLSIIPGSSLLTLVPRGSLL